MKLLLTLLFICSISYAKIIRIGIMDSGYFPDDDTTKIHFCSIKNFTKNTIDENGMHGNNILHIITDGLPYDKYCIIMIKVLNDNGEYMPYIKGYEYAASSQLDILNLSIAGFGYIPFEKYFISKMLDKNTIVVAAAGNNRKIFRDNECPVNPACVDNRIISVGSVDKKGNISVFSNWGMKNETCYEMGENVEAGGFIFSGTSQATAKHTRRLVNEMIKRDKTK